MSDFPRKIKYGAKKNFRCFYKRVGLINSGVARNFKKGGHNFHIFFKRIFFGRTKLKLIEKQEKF